MDLQDIIWICGFYEGEGTISNDISNNNSIRLCIYQNENCFIEYQKVYGGKIYKRERKSPTSDKICINHEWRLCRTDAEKFINDIRQYMKTQYKINQLESVLQKSKEKPIVKYKCNYCDKYYANPSGRRRHEKQNHL